MTTERNPWGSSSPLDVYCDGIIPRVEGTTIRRAAAAESDELLGRLMTADRILQEKRRVRFQDRIREIESDAKSIFSSDSSQDIVESCRVLIDAFDYSITKSAENIQGDAYFSDHLLLDKTSRSRLDILLKIMNVSQEKLCEIHEVKFTIEKLILDAKLKAMSSTNALSAIERLINEQDKPT